MEKTQNTVSVVEHGSSLRHHDSDEELLARTGKRTILKRNFGFIPVLAFNMLTLNTWLGPLELFGIGLANGGPAGLIYSFLVVWAGTLATFSTLCELVSMAPTSGGQYHWVSMLAPTSSQKFLSYVTGWLTVCGWQAGTASGAYICGLLLQSFIETVRPTYAPALWHATLLTYLSILVALIVTTLAARWLPAVEYSMLIIFTIGFFAVYIPLLVLAPHGTAQDVFKTFLNEGGWSTVGLSFFVGISANAFVFLGADSIFHMSEEIRHAAVTVPRAMMLGIMLNGIFGLASYIAILFCSNLVFDSLSSEYSLPFVYIFVAGLKSRGGAAAILALMIVIQAGLVVNCTAATLRQLWSFARDRGVPFWRQLQRVGTADAIPLVSTGVTVTVSVLLCLISVGSPVAFNDVISLTIAALYASYFVPCTLMLWRRLSGSIVNPQYVSEEELATMNLPGRGGKMAWGPWRMPPIIGTLANIFACFYLVVVFFFSFWPPVTPVTPKLMNYSSVVFGAVALFSGAFYFFVGRKQYLGPVVDTT